MIIHITIPHFWIAVEEQRRPELEGRPVVIGGGFLEKSAAGARALMANDVAGEYGVRAGMSLAHVRHLCPEAVILSPELAFYREVRDEITAILLSYTPLVEWLEGGEAACDVRGCERLFGEPAQLASRIILEIEQVSGLRAVAGAGSNRLVAQLAAQHAAGSVFRVRPVEQGREAEFLAPLPLTSLPEIDDDTLLTFKVLGLRTFGDLASLSLRSLERRFGSLGKRLGRYSRGEDDRPVRPAPEEPAVRVSRSCDDDFGQIDPRQALAHIAQALATDLSSELQRRNMAGQLLILTLRYPRTASGTGTGPSSGTPLPIDPARARTAMNDHPPQADWFPSQEPRIHSMLPQPRRPSTHRPRSEPPMPSLALTDVGARAEPDPFRIVRAGSRLAASRPLRDERSLREITGRLLERLISDIEAKTATAQPGAELQLEMRQFAPPEQLTLFRFNARDRTDPRWGRLQRQEALLKRRFGATPFRHLAAVDVDSVLEERRFEWAEGLE
ncbi:MAG TPA: hypothetical protein VFB34_13905 [Chloroflexota bacterium]|nr:hypothetical protein [Chloroflexota bacterium]